MAATPLDNIKTLSLRLTVKVEGAAIADTYAVSSVSITHAINKISYAELTIIGNIVPEDGDVPISDSTDFDPGKEIEITAGYGSNAEESLFKGYIVRHALEVDSKSPFTLKLFCRHKAVMMTFNKKESSFKDKKDSDIITAVVGEYSGLSATTTATTTTYEMSFQKMATDWDFILSRAEFNGHVITMDGQGYNLVVGPPKLSEASIMTIAVGVSMLAFEAELNAEDQPPSLNASGWDAKTQALVKSAAAEPSVNSQGSITPKTLSTKLSQKALDLVSPTPMPTAELKIWADGILLRKRLAAFKGKVQFLGTAKVKSGSIITLEGVGTKFNGDAFVSAVTHQLDSGNWVTTAKFGLDDYQIVQAPDFASYPAGGQLPPVHGLQIGTVKKLSGDPKSEGRIQVTVPSTATTPPEIWARYVNFYATADAGSGFMPEVGDEVVLGFLDNDPRYPVIVGSVYSSKNKSPNQPSDENNYIKSLVTKAKLKVTFNDEKKSIKIETPGANSIFIDDEGKGIEIKDQNGNSIKLSSDGITLNSAKDIILKATGNVTVNATAKLTLDAKQDVAVSGLNVNATAQVGFAAKGNATAELSASGQTTVKGAMVMIN